MYAIVFDLYASVASGYKEEDSSSGSSSVVGSTCIYRNCVVIETPQRLPERDKFMGQQKKKSFIKKFATSFVKSFDRTSL